MNSPTRTRTSLSVGALFSCALCSLPAAGQVPPSPVPPVQAPASCYPFGIRGDAVFDINWFKRTDNGWYILWFCRQPDASYTVNYRYCRHGACDQNAWLQTQIAAAMAPDKGVVLDAAPYAVTPCADEVKNATLNTAICNDVLSAVAVEGAKLPKPAPVPTPTPAPAPAPSPAPAPPPPAFWVKTNALLADGSQATYTVSFAAGIPTRGVPTGSRAGPHAPCDPAVRITIFGSSTTWYMLVPNSSPMTVVLCEKVP